MYPAFENSTTRIAIMLIRATRVMTLTVIEVFNAEFETNNITLPNLLNCSFLYLLPGHTTKIAGRAKDP